jgi:hypothetical protein
MCVIFLVVSSSLAAFNIDLWQNLRFSEKTSEGNVYIRTEIDQTNINTNKLVYASGGSLTEMDFSGLRPGTYQALLQREQAELIMAFAGRQDQLPMK